MFLNFAAFFPSQNFLLEVTNDNNILLKYIFFINCQTVIDENKSNIFDCLYFVWIIFISMCNDSIWMGQIIKHKLDSLSFLC